MVPIQMILQSTLKEATQPVENLKIFVEHPDYLTLRKVPEVNYYYKIDQDYRIEKVEEGP